MIDDIQKLATWRAESEQRDLRDIQQCRAMEALHTLAGAAREATSDAAKLARAVLAMLPVVRAAEKHEAVRRECQRTGSGHAALVVASYDLENAIYALHEEMRKG